MGCAKGEEQLEGNQLTTLDYLRIKNANQNSSPKPFNTGILI
jgi:hypothetical protein